MNFSGKNLSYKIKTIEGDCNTFLKEVINKQFECIKNINSIWISASYCIHQ